MISELPSLQLVLVGDDSAPLHFFQNNSLIEGEARIHWRQDTIEVKSRFEFDEVCQLM